VSAAPSSALRILDVNLRQHYFSEPIIRESLALANVLKVNDTELPRLAEMLELNGDERSQISQLASRHNLHGVAYTVGSGGACSSSRAAGRTTRASPPRWWTPWAREMRSPQRWRWGYWPAGTSTR